MPWFPRPDSPEDVKTLPPTGRWTAGEIYELLNDPEGMEWRDRVGVVGRADGSAKSSTRLLRAWGWVAKTRVDQACASEAVACERIFESRAPGLAARLWHPAKQWALVRGSEGWYALTLCPELRTLRQVGSTYGRMHGWIEMLRMATRVHNQHGFGLDLNPANFGTAGEDAHLYYIDDELYPPLVERDVAGAIVARIPEEPWIEHAAWEAWAGTLVDTLRREPMNAFDWERFCDELQRYPVTERFEERRAALAAIFREPLATARARHTSRASSKVASLTCVLADVHANLPALEATLKAAKELGADSYLFVGDAVGYGPHPSECIQRLAELGNATLLRGNHDQAIATGRLDVGMNRLARRCAEWTMSVLAPGEIEWLGSLPVEHVTEEWMAVHGAPRDPRKFLAYVYELTFEDNLRYLQQLAVPLCFYGHTHVQFVHLELTSGPAKLSRPEVLELTPRGPALVNPGSVGQPRDGDPRAAFALWDRVRRRISFHRTHYDLERTLRDLRSRALPAELEERLTAGT